MVKLQIGPVLALRLNKHMLGDLARHQNLLQSARRYVFQTSPKVVRRRP
jgi:hypothetical protein